MTAGLVSRLGCCPEARAFILHAVRASRIRRTRRAPFGNCPAHRHESGPGVRARVAFGPCRTGGRVETHCAVESKTAYCAQARMSLFGGTRRTPRGLIPRTSPVLTPPGSCSVCRVEEGPPSPAPPLETAGSFAKKHRDQEMTPRHMTASDNDGLELGPAEIAELRRLARSHPRSGREAVAKASAIRTLERLSRERRRQEVPPMPEGWYPHEPGHPFYELDWVFLHRHPHILERHWRRAWREGRA
jgi:hypothetical protein